MPLSAQSLAPLAQASKDATLQILDDSFRLRHDLVSAEQKQQWQQTLKCSADAADEVSTEPAICLHLLCTALCVTLS